MASAKVCSSEALEFTQPEPFTPHHLSPPNASTRVLEDSFFTELRVRSLQAETVTLASPQYIHSFQKHFLDTYHGRPALSGAGVQRKSEGALSSGSLQLGGRQTWQKEHTCDAGVMVLREDGRGGGGSGLGDGDAGPEGFLEKPYFRAKLKNAQARAPPSKAAAGVERGGSGRV